MVVNEQSPPADFGDTSWWWDGRRKVGDIQLDGASSTVARSCASRAVRPGPSDPFKEGIRGLRDGPVPVGPVSLFVVGWYTTGDDAVGRRRCQCCGLPSPGTNGWYSRIAGRPDALPGGLGQAPDPGVRRWLVRRGGGPYIAEWLYR